MQALSFAVHIPLVAFGIAFPAMVLFAEWLWLRTGDPLYRTLARRWTRIMVALFAVGVITGTILSFEMGLLWPNFMATFGGVFGLGFAIEGFSFFLEAIFIGIYVYGWDRLSPRAHFLSGIPIVITGFTGSLMVIAVNALDEPPGRLHAARRQGRSTCTRGSALFGNAYLWHELVHMYFAGYIVVGLPARRRLRVRAAARALGPLRAHGARDPADDRGARRAGAGARRRLGGARRRAHAAGQARRVRGARADDDGARRSTCSAGTRTARSSSASRSRTLLSLLAFHNPNAKVQGLDAVPADRPPAGQRRPLRVPDDGRDRHAAGAARRRLRRRARAAASGCRVALVLPRARRSPGRCRSSR